MASEVWENIRKVEKERDLAVASFKSAEQKGHFKSPVEANKIRAKLEQVDTLLKEAKIDAHRSRPHHANDKVRTAHGLIEEAYKLSAAGDRSGPGSSEIDAADQTSEKVSPAPISDGPKLIPAPSSD